MPLPNTREYASSVIKRSVKKDTISALDSASSCPTSSSSDGSEAEADVAAARTRSRGRRRLLRLKYSLKADAASYKMPSLHYVIPHDKCSDKALVVIPNLLRKKKISKMEALFLASPSRYVINDRKSDLVYQHAAHRVEVCLRTEYPRLYRKLMSISLGLCQHVYGPVADLVKRPRIFPEFEHIIYDSSGAFIEPHVDNHSVITGIVMLSERDVEFEGGINCFEPNRHLVLQQGDCVLFRGEQTEHWITPVSKGVRRILQWEFSRI